MLRVAMMGAAVALAVSAAGAAFAEEMPSYLLTIFPNGRIITAPLDTKMTQEVMGHSKTATEPMMIMVTGGKAYTAADIKMPNGKMMSEYMATDYWTWMARQH